MNPEMIRADASNRLIVPDFPIIPFVRGHGVGREIWPGARMVLDAAVKTAFSSKKKIKWLDVGKKQKNTQAFPDEALAIFKHHRVAIKGPLEPFEGALTPDIKIQKALGLFVCVRPIKYLLPVSAPVRHLEHLDIVVFKENIREPLCPVEKKFPFARPAHLVDLLKCRISQDLSLYPLGRKSASPLKTGPLVIKAFEYAFANRRKSVTLTYAGNTVRQGGCVTSGSRAAVAQFGSRIITEDSVFGKYEGLVPDGLVVIQERMAEMVPAEVLLRPENFDVIVCPDVSGQALSDALADMVDSPGMAYGAHMGEDCAVFEAFHSTAPDLAGRDLANPCALILSGAMMLDHLGWQPAGDLVRNAVTACLAAGRVTRDLVSRVHRGEQVPCSRFSRIVAEHILYQQ